LERKIDQARADKEKEEDGTFVLPAISTLST
jgi:hypothetical protein